MHLRLECGPGQRRNLPKNMEDVQPVLLPPSVERCPHPPVSVVVGLTPTTGRSGSGSGPRRARGALGAGRARHRRRPYVRRSWRGPAEVAGRVLRHHASAPRRGEAGRWARVEERRASERRLGVEGRSAGGACTASNDKGGEQKRWRISVSAAGS